MSTETKQHNCDKDDCVLDRWKVKTTLAQHEALSIISNALSEFLRTGDWDQSSPYTGHGSYVVLSHVQMAILFPDAEIYRGQRGQA